jgi:hypothetical protein
MTSELSKVEFLRTELNRCAEVLDGVWKYAGMTDVMRTALEDVVRSAESALNSTRPDYSPEIRFDAAHNDEEVSE